MKPWNVASHARRCRPVVNSRLCQVARLPGPGTTRCPVHGKRPRRLRVPELVSCRCASSSTDSRYRGWWGWKEPAEGRYYCTNNSNDRWGSRLRFWCIVTATTWRLAPRSWFQRDILVSRLDPSIFSLLFFVSPDRYCSRKR